MGASGSTHQDQPDLEQLYLKTKITDQYFSLAKEYGISKVNLDHIATELSISKKTIYKLFSNKEEIISACIDDIFSRIDAEIIPVLHNTSLDIIEKIILLPQLVSKHLNFFSQQQATELQRSFPHLWDKVVKLRTEKLERYEALFQLAISKELIIDIDPKLIVQFYTSALNVFTDATFMSEHNLTYTQALQTVSKILLDGILKK